MTETEHVVTDVTNDGLVYPVTLFGTRLNDGAHGVHVFALLNGELAIYDESSLDLRRDVNVHDLRGTPEYVPVCLALDVPVVVP